MRTGKTGSRLGPGHRFRASARTGSWSPNRRSTSPAPSLCPADEDVKDVHLLGDAEELVVSAAGPGPYVRLDTWVGGDQLEDLAQRKVLDGLRGLHDRQGARQTSAVEDLVGDGSRGFGHTSPFAVLRVVVAGDIAVGNHFDLIH